MYEEITFERIMKRMLERIPPEYDKREGGILYNALAPAAVELQNMYIGLDWALDQSFADTQEWEYLVRRCAERGLVPEAATHAVLKGEFNMDIPVGSRFSLGLLNYVAVERIGAGVYRMECEQAGEAGNRQMGSLIPIDFIQGLTRAELTELLIPGENEESTEHLRQRYFDSLNSQAFGGNIRDYQEKTRTLDGVGGVKVYPVWNGGGTVRLVILDASFGKPSAELLANVQDAADPERSHGSGLGFAPIGHVVTVDAVAEVPVNISMDLTLREGWSWADVSGYVDSCVEGYLGELRRQWEGSDGLIVRISQLEARILDLTGVVDIAAGTTLNGKAANLLVGADEIPVKGEINGTAVNWILS